MVQAIEFDQYQYVPPQQRQHNDDDDDDDDDDGDEHDDDDELAEHDEPEPELEPEAEMLLDSPAAIYRRGVSSAKKKFCNTKGLEGATIARRVADLVRPVISLGFPSSSRNSGQAGGDQGNGTSTTAPVALDEGELTTIDITSLATKLKGEKITGGIIQAIADVLMLTTMIAHIVKDECSNKSLTTYRRNYLVNAHKTDKINNFEHRFALDPDNIVELFYSYDDLRTTAGLPKPTDLLKFFEPIKEAREYFTGKKFERAFRRSCLFAIYGPAAVLLSSEKRSDFLNVGKWTKEEFRGKLGALVDKPALIKDILTELGGTGIQSLLDARVISQMHRFKVESVGWVDVSKIALGVLGFPAGVGYFAQVSEEGSAQEQPVKEGA
ncbi:hypothetical protein GGF32_002482 [Allomyces javanicus]|nr:hypothetical protein GGF32_002482 [Allomyces javanicus]